MRLGQLMSWGKNSFRIDFFDTNFKFENKDCKCDFDLDDNKLPLLHDGSQEYIIPYLYKLKEKYPEFDKAKFQTNNNFIFKLV